jgi:hypothetical protein
MGNNEAMRNMASNIPQIFGLVNNHHNNNQNSNKRKKEEININEVFEDIEEISEDIYTGIGIKKMKAYKCDLPIDELNKKREHFWEIKTNHKNKNWPIWNTIKRAVLFDEYRAELLLEEYKIKTVNGCINHLIDEKGNYYKIPNFCINDPYFGKLNENINDIREEKVKLKIYGFKKFEMEINNKLRGNELKNEIKNKELLGDDKIIRLFYRGKEILDEDYIFNHDLNECIPIMLLVK